MPLLATPAHTPWRAWPRRSVLEAGHRPPGPLHEEGATSGKRYTNRLHAEATRWQHVAGEPTAADGAGPYSHEQFVRMDADFVAAAERAFAAGLESPRAACATYAITSRAACLLHFAGIALAPSAKSETSSKALDVFFFGGNLFLGDGRFNKPSKRQRVKAAIVMHFTMLVVLTAFADGLPSFDHSAMP